MTTMDHIYNNLKQQKAIFEKELSEKKRVLRDISAEAERQNITIKKIHGELYYYAQCRKEGKVKSTYLSPVMPGSIADFETIQNNIKQLSKDICELEENIKSLEKMLACCKKTERKKSIMDDFSFEVYWKDEITARVYIKKKDVIVSRYSENPGKQLFSGKKMTRYQLGKILEMR